MSTIVLRRRVFAKSRRRMPVNDRIAKYAGRIYDEYGPEIICGMLAMDRNRDSFQMYRVFKRDRRRTYGQ